MRFKNTQRRSPIIHIWCRMYYLSSSLVSSSSVSSSLVRPCSLIDQAKDIRETFFDLVTLTFDL